MYKKIILYILIALIFPSCVDEILKEVPKDFISAENFYQNTKQMEDALVGAYWGLWSGANHNSYKNCMAVHTDYGVPSGSYRSYGNWDSPFAFDRARRDNDNYFDGFYELINLTNIIIDRAPSTENINENTLRRILGEAHFLRAFAYFELVKFWGPVPIRTEEYTGASELAIPRAPKNEVYDLIISDLSIAEKDAPEDVGSETGRASRSAAKMLLANVYLDKEDWNKAAEKAGELITSNRYSLVPVNKWEDYHQIFRTKSTNSEEIMAFHFSNDVKPTFMQWYHGVGSPWNTGVTWGFTNFVYDQSPFYLNWDDSDLRKEASIYNSYIDKDGNLVVLSGHGSPRFKRWTKDENGDALYNIPIFRLAEAYLVYAEASCMADGNPSSLALERLNIIKRRGYGYDPYSLSEIDYPSGMSKDEFRNAVIQERGYEYFTEERRWWDLIRTGTAREVIGEAYGTVVHESRLLFPISIREIESNPAINKEDQNPGY